MGSSQRTRLASLLSWQYGFPLWFFERPLPPWVCHVAGAIFLIGACTYAHRWAFINVAEGIFFILMGLRLTHLDSKAREKRLQDAVEKLVLLFIMHTIREDKDGSGLDKSENVEFYDRFATLCMDIHRNFDAEILLRTVVSMREKEVGVDHPWVTTCRSNLALALEAQGKYEEAESLFQHSMRILEQYQVSEHPYMINIMEHYARFLRKRKRFAEARALGRRIALLELAARPPK